MNFNAETARDNFFKFHLKVKEVSRMIGETLIKEIEDKLKAESIHGGNIISYPFEERFDNLFTNLKNKSEDNIKNILIHSQMKMEFMAKLFINKDLEQSGFIAKDGVDVGSLIIYFITKDEKEVFNNKDVVTPVASVASPLSQREKFDMVSKQNMVSKQIKDL
jgi:hypothetical protein